jgi:hypothetical protein
MTRVKEHFKNDNDRRNEWLAHEHGEVAIGGRQTSLAEMWGR